MWQYLRSNLSLVLLSLFMSLIVWAVITNQQNPRITRLLEASVPVEARNVPSGLVVQSVRDSAVHLRVSTNLDHWSSIAPTSFKAYVDLSKGEAGSRDYRIQVDNSDNRVNVELVEPELTEVRLSVQKRKNVPVRVNFIDSVPFGYETKAPVIEPAQVEIVGPQNLVEATASAVVDLSLSGARSTINQSFNVEARDSTGKLVTGVEVAPSTVSVELDIEQQVAYKLVSVVPDLVGTVALGYQIVGVVPDPSTVTIVADPHTLERVSQVSTSKVDVNKLSTDLHQSVEIVLPAGMSLARSQPVTVRVFVNAMQGSQAVRVTPTFNGLAEDAMARLTPVSVDVTLSGPMPSLLSLRPNDVRVVIDVSSLKPGSHPVQPSQLQVVAPTGLQVLSVSPQNLVVNIE